MASLHRGLFAYHDTFTIDTTWTSQAADASGTYRPASELPAGQMFYIRSVVFRLDPAGRDTDEQLFFYLSLGSGAASITGVYAAEMNHVDYASARRDFDPPLPICIDARAAWTPISPETKNTIYVFCRSEQDTFDAIAVEVHWEQPAI